MLTTKYLLLKNSVNHKIEQVQRLKKVELEYFDM